MSKTQKSNEQKSGIPIWVKRTGAIIGIIATVVTVFTGIHALVVQFKTITLEIEKERTKQSQTAKAQEETRLERSNREVENIKYQHQIEKERTLQRQAERKRAQVELQKQRNDMSREEAARIHNEAVQREQRVLQAISDFVDSDQATFSALLILSEYAEPNGDYQDLMKTAFVAKSEKTESIAEARLIFKLFDGIGVSAFESVVQINRIALRQFSFALLTLFWSQTQIAIESALKNSVENKLEGTARLLEQHPSDLIAPIIRRISQQVLSIGPPFQSLIMSEEWAKFEALYKSSLLPALNKTSPDDIKRALTQTQALFKVQDMEAARRKLIVYGEILNQSNRFIEKFLPEAAQSGHYDDQKIDLSNTYLVGVQIDGGDFKALSIDFYNALFRPNTDIFENNVVRFALSEEGQESFKTAQQNIKRRLQKMEQFMTL